MLQTGGQITTSESERYFLVYMIVVLIIISALIIVFFILFQKRKNKLILDKIKQQQRFEKELTKTQQEIQDETLKHVGRELHDNVGQLLAFATMQLNAAAKVVSDDVKYKVNNASDALKESLAEVRALSKSLNSDVIFNLGFYKTVKNEINRLNKSGLIKAELNITGNKVSFENKKDEIILFRILQEFFSNTLKYAKAEELSVTIIYGVSTLDIKAKDNGKGFNISSVEKSSGLINMEKRAELINANFNLYSKPNRGTELIISYPYRKDIA